MARAWGVHLEIVTWSRRPDVFTVNVTTDDLSCFFFFQAEDGIRDLTVTGVQTYALPISRTCWWCATTSPCRSASCGRGRRGRTAGTTACGASRNISARPSTPGCGSGSAGREREEGGGGKRVGLGGRRIIKKKKK